MLELHGDRATVIGCSEVQMMCAKSVNDKNVKVKRSVMVERIILRRVGWIQPDLLKKTNVYGRKDRNDSSRRKNERRNVESF